MERAGDYLNQSLKYLENALKASKDGDPEKVGEFLWGSVATALKALVMAKKGLEVKRHSQFWEIARELARETGDLSIYEGFKEANSLHTNFYEFQLSLDDVKGAAERIAQLVEKLIDLTEEAMKEQSEIALEASSDGVLRRQRP
jgi:HEPN domain-containing protein